MASRSSGGGRRLPTTVLFTDIVDSTVRARELGDERWRQILRNHHATVRRELKRHGGREIDNAGDGFFAAFESPDSAIRCACAIIDSIRPLGIDVRAGIHVGEAVLVGDKPGGLGVHIGSRIAGLAHPNEVLVSATARDLTEGSGIRFEDRGAHALKGIEGSRQVFTVIRDGELAQKDSAPVIVAEPGPGRRRIWLAAAGAAVVVTGLLLLRPDPSEPTRPTSSPGPADPVSALYRVDIAEHREAGVNTEAITYDVAVEGGFLWIAERRAVGKWSLTRDAYVEHIRLGPANSPVEPLFVATGRGRVFVGAVGPAPVDPGQVASGFLLYEIDAADGTVSEPVQLPSQPTALTVGERFVWATTAAGPLIRVSLDDGRAREVTSYASSPVAIAADAGRVYVADADGLVVVIDERTGKKLDSTEIAEPTAIAVGHGSAWVTSDEFGTGGDEQASTLVRLDARSLELQEPIPLPNAPEDIAVTDDAVWVASTSGVLIRVDPAQDARVGMPIQLHGGLIRELFIAATAEDVFVSVSR